MYERGSNSWHDLSYGSVYSASNGSPNGSGSYNGAEQNGHTNGYAPAEPLVQYRSPSGEDTSSRYAAYAPPQNASPLYTPSDTAPTYDRASTYDSTSYESAYQSSYAPASTQSMPAVAAPASTTDVTTYDPATGLPANDFVYPMRNVAGRMAMILGVFGILFTSILFPLFPVAFFFALGAIVLGRRGRLRARYGFASNPGSAGGGYALGVISMALVVVWSGLAAWLFMTYSANDLKNCVQDTHNAAEGIHCVADVVDAG